MLVKINVSRVPTARTLRIIPMKGDQTTDSVIRGISTMVESLLAIAVHTQLDNLVYLFPQ
ncbi:hypothetical protein D3C72_2546240 [compost metagenome]